MHTLGLRNIYEPPCGRLPAPKTFTSINFRDRRFKASPMVTVRPHAQHKVCTSRSTLRCATALFLFGTGMLARLQLDYKLGFQHRRRELGSKAPLSLLSVGRSVPNANTWDPAKGPTTQHTSSQRPPAQVPGTLSYWHFDCYCGRRNLLGQHLARAPALPKSDQLGPKSPGPAPALAEPAPVLLEPVRASRDLSQDSCDRSQD
jgi:hypothetical protein